MSELVEVTISRAAWQELFNALLTTPAGDVVMNKDEKGRDVIGFSVPAAEGAGRDMQVAIYWREPIPSTPEMNTPPTGTDPNNIVDVP